MVDSCFSWKILFLFFFVMKNILSSTTATNMLHCSVNSVGVIGGGFCHLKPNIGLNCAKRK